MSSSVMFAVELRLTPVTLMYLSAVTRAIFSLMLKHFLNAARAA
jgi:hypothetical protein